RKPIPASPAPPTTQPQTVSKDFSNTMMLHHHSKRWCIPEVLDDRIPGQHYKPASMHNLKREPSNTINNARAASPEPG
ncbi:hypothetical protein, partial [Pseudomonas viridiflava]|uniref:hypothetical protein n=1 Tax=Pseudomonas viridiflava TaxID=33069 RepID=UPI00197ED991